MKQKNRLLTTVLRRCLVSDLETRFAPVHSTTSTLLCSFSQPGSPVSPLADALDHFGGPIIGNAKNNVWPKNMTSSR